MPVQHKVETVQINGVELKTRFWYMDCAKDLTGAERHRTYYGQFCTPAIKRVVASHFNKAEWALMARAWNSGEDVYFNECTKMAKWDQLQIKQMVGRLVSETEYSDLPKGVLRWSPSQNACIAKEAAGQLIESNEYPQ